MPLEELDSSHFALFIQTASIHLQASLETTGILSTARLLMQPLQQIHRNIQLWSILVTSGQDAPPSRPMNYACYAMLGQSKKLLELLNNPPSLLVI